jgi:hypothetical protein
VLYDLLFHDSSEISVSQVPFIDLLFLASVPFMVMLAEDLEAYVFMWLIESIAIICMVPTELFQ